VTVTNVNEAPAIITDGGEATATRSIFENTTAVTIVKAIDPDTGTTLTYAISGGADAAQFLINAETGALSFIFSPNFEVPTDIGANNIYDVIVSSSDGTLSDTQAIAVTVTNANEAPVITSNGGRAMAACLVAENSRAVTSVQAFDPDFGAKLTYAIVGGPDAAQFQINAATGVLSFRSAPNFEAPADAGANNVYNVIVSASDGMLTLDDTQAIAVTVTNVNEAPTIRSNGGGSTAALSAFENTTAVTTVKATDPDAGARLTYAITGGADAALFAISPGTDALTFKSAPDFEAPGDTGGDNVYGVIVTASDGTLSDTQELAVTVTNLGEAPNYTIVTGTATKDTLTGTIGDDQIFGLAGNDKLYGDAGTDILSGGNGVDRLYGGTSADTLSGGGDSDFFIFNTAPDGDTITDFTRTDGDKILLSKAVLTAFAVKGVLSADAYYAAAGADAAHDSSDRIIYNTITGALWFDADGTGAAAARLVATLGDDIHPELAYADILIIA
jgi:Ca2+-binding RTX toxin-like protein